MAAYRLGIGAATAVVAIGILYVAALVAGVSQVGLHAPIVDPVLAIMEVLTLLSALAVVITMAVVQHDAAAERRVYATLALGFALIFAGITSTVHFVELTATRQLGTAGIVWPTAAYAAELLAWDWFLGISLVFASLVFTGDGRERVLRRALLASGALALVGTVGPVMGDLRVQRIGIVGLDMHWCCRIRSSRSPATFTRGGG